MNSLVTGTANLNLSKPDAGGNFGYFLTFNFKYQEDNHEGTIKMGSGVGPEYVYVIRKNISQIISVIMLRRLIL